MKRIISEQDIQRMTQDGVFKVAKDMIITPWAREWALRHNIKLQYETSPSSEDIPVEAVQELDKTAELVAMEVLKTLSEGNKGDEAGKNVEETGGYAGPSFSNYEEEDENIGVVVATGMNRPGVAATLSAAISECGGDIRDISQTLAGDYYSMIFVVDTKNISSRNLSFMEFKHIVQAAGERVGAHCVVLNARVLKAMHRV